MRGNIDIREVLALFDEHIQICDHSISEIKARREYEKLSGDYIMRLAHAKIERQHTKDMKRRAMAYFENPGEPAGMMTLIQRHDPEFLESLGITFTCEPNGR